jgi:Fe-Mn family superoxide dismutase
MKKREFLRTAGILGAGIALSPVLAYGSANGPQPEVVPGSGPENPFSLPELGYATNALEPAIDALTMQIHHDKHHAAYVEKLNTAMNGKPYRGTGVNIETILPIIVAEDSAIRNNAGGHYNHSMLWKWMKPGGAKVPPADLANAIKTTFTSLDEFKKQFAEAAKSRFGSGWAWLSVGDDKKLFISSTPDQDNPLMEKLVDQPGTPILGIDVWEHAYYLKYQNKRPDYITAFMGIINWDEVNEGYKKAING